MNFALPGDRQPSPSPPPPSWSSSSLSRRGHNHSLPPSTTMQHNSGSPQQFCLRWNNYQTNLTNVFDQLLQSESFVDVTLACDGHSVKAHKMVLSACSPYFQSLFFENPCQHPIVIMRDIKWPELKAAVEFMYKGEINVSQEQIGPLLKVAESLKIRGLADVNGEQDVVSSPGEILGKAKASTASGLEWEARQDGSVDTGAPRVKKRRRPSGERSSLSSPAESAGAADVSEAPPSVEMSPAPPVTPLSTTTAPPEPLPLTLPLTPQQPITQGHSTHNAPPTAAASDDMEIKPGIAEMIREEERMGKVEFFESSRSKPVAAWEGFSYRKKKEFKNGNVYWVCSDEKRRKCKGSIVTNKDIVEKAVNHSCKAPDPAAT